MLDDAISTFARGDYKTSRPCPELVHSMVESKNEDDEVYLKDAQDQPHDVTVVDKCPTCGNPGLLLKTDYICYKCRQKRCTQCSGTGLVGAGQAQPAFLRTAKGAVYNSDLANEASALHRLCEQFQKVGKQHFLPAFIETREESSRRANIFLDEGWDLYSLAQIRERYPEGIDPKDMAWMFRRLIQVIGLANEVGYTHGSILPPNVLIDPENHGLVLWNWAYAVKRPGRIRTMVSDYKDWYPPEVGMRQNVLVGADLYMAAKCMEWVMGDQEVPDRIRYFLKGMQNPLASKRVNNAREVWQQFHDLVVGVWGERKYHPFTMESNDLTVGQTGE